MNNQQTRIKLSTTQPNFCMPSALACLTGKTVDECITIYQKELGNIPITGVYYPILLKILDELGYSYQELDRREANKFIGDMIVFVHGHVMVYDSIVKKFYDPASPNGRELPHYSKFNKIFAVRYPPVKSRSELFSRIHR
jgi:hypothetical protein